MAHLRCTRVALLLCVVAGFTPGCGHPPVRSGVAKPKVAVAPPELRKGVIEYEEFTGRTDAVKSVDLRPRVGGTLKEIWFKDGEEVEQGWWLFSIDPDIYLAEYEKAKNQVAVHVAMERVSQTDYETSVRAGDAPQKISQYKAKADEAVASLRAAEAHRRRIELDLRDTEVYAPIAGRMGRVLVDAGNLVDSSAVLATLVQVDPIVAYFDVSDRVMLRYQDQVREKKLKAKEASELAVEIFLSNGKKYPHSGQIDFVDNRLDKGTGTVAVRAVFENPLDRTGQRDLKAGMFVRLRLPSSDPYEALVVPEKAIGNDQGQKFLYVVGEKNEAVYLPVKLGPLLADGHRVIKAGLTAEQRVIVAGGQNVRPGAEVEIDPTTK